MINEQHYQRVSDMLMRTKGSVALGGHFDPSRRKMDITVVKDVQAGDSLLEEEIFGPILALVPVNVSGSRNSALQNILTPRK